MLFNNATCQEGPPGTMNDITHIKGHKSPDQTQAAHINTTDSQPGVWRRLKNISTGVSMGMYG